MALTPGASEIPATNVTPGEFPNNKAATTVDRVDPLINSSDKFFAELKAQGIQVPEEMKRKEEATKAALDELIEGATKFEQALGLSSPQNIVDDTVSAEQLPTTINETAPSPLGESPINAKKVVDSSLEVPPQAPAKLANTDDSSAAVKSDEAILTTEPVTTYNPYEAAKEKFRAEFETPNTIIPEKTTETNDKLTTATVQVNGETLEKMFDKTGIAKAENAKTEEIETAKIKEAFEKTAKLWQENFSNMTKEQKEAQFGPDMLAILEAKLGKTKQGQNLAPEEPNAEQVIPLTLDNATPVEPKVPAAEIPDIPSNSDSGLVKAEAIPTVTVDMGEKLTSEAVPTAKKTSDPITSQATDTGQSATPAQKEASPLTFPAEVVATPEISKERLVKFITEYGVPIGTAKILPIAISNGESIGIGGRSTSEENEILFGLDTQPDGTATLFYFTNGFRAVASKFVQRREEESATMPLGVGLKNEGVHNGKFEANVGFRASVTEIKDSNSETVLTDEKVNGLIELNKKHFEELKLKKSKSSAPSTDI
jgi:hypothetical protein